MEKKCRGCGETKSLEEYYTEKMGKYGRKAKCKVCTEEIKKAYRQSEAGKAKRKAYEQSEARKAKRKAYEQLEVRKSKKKAYMKVYDQSEAGKAKRKAYRQSEAGKAAQKKYRQSEAGKVRRKATRNNRYYNDPTYKLHCILRSGFRNWIQGNTKTCSTEKYIGATYQELLDHLESQFEEGMSWENQGEWHIDHIKAQSRFDPTNEEEKFMCWHYTNLQPMWASENIRWKDKKKTGDEFVIWMDREIGWVNIEDVVNV